MLIRIRCQAYPLNEIPEKLNRYRGHKSVLQPREACEVLRNVSSDRGVSHRPRTMEEAQDRTAALPQA